MKVTRVETRCVRVKLDKPISSALGQLHSFGCILVFVHCDSGIVGENLIFTLNARRTRVLQSMIEEMADLVIGHDAGHIASFWARAWRDINFLGHKGVPVVVSTPDSPQAQAFRRVAEEVARQVSIEAMKPELVVLGKGQ